MKLKLNPDGSAVVQNGMPVYVHSDGSEHPFDAAGTVEALNRRHFETSKFVTERLTVPVDVALAAFGPSFKVEGGKVVAHDRNGIKVLSHARLGEDADFEEAIERLVNQYPSKDQILRAAGSSSSAPSQSGGGGGQQKKIGNLSGSREERTAALANRFPELS
ncbi:DUF6651 domain-containing protein [Herbaspirillum sp. SJZ107]|uniref:DUF6651 domain-containing protein n=1 Tax=Herbaspirillum sp. SJZ107 TaxID=2572881 RepID=UPI001154A703|nr:DUF6651 domain-containing protein [Herbaspirillum sp. SJZ107]TQK00154.1 hypothetical protein FBX97_5819 [Herbaspirillum sp. SJZ107]